MKTNYNELVYTMVNDIYRIIDEIDNDDKLCEYLVSLDEDLDTEINEYNDITMAAIKITTDRYYDIKSENETVNYLTYIFRKNMKKMAELIKENNSLKEYVMEVYGSRPFGFRDVLMQSLDCEDYEGVVSIIMLEEIINC